MDVGDKMKELNMTADEMDRLKKAFKDEKFREMLRDYAQELSDPENKRRYEEEIKLLEQERGNTIEFIHPEPYKALRTSVNGKQKCFINICSNEKVGKPECKCGESEDGRRGQCWSLPHSLPPGRPDTDPKGNKIMIYDVIFHPDTLHIAGKNKRFMDMVDSTAIQGIQEAFKVTLDKNNMRQMRTKYKGTPQPCVIRKPIPGYKAKGPSEESDPLAFPYPDEKRPPTSLQNKPTESPATKNSSDAAPKSSSIQPQTAKEPTEPNYTVKYRSFVDIQDFRCSRDSAQSPRPKEIVVTIDLPLLKAATDASLEVKEKWLLLESMKPAYKLELPLAYPVDEDKGEAKFSKQRGQLIVTLPVLPSVEAFDFAVGPAQASVSEDETQEEKSEEEKEQRDVQGGVTQQTGEEKSEEEGERGQEKVEEKMRDGVAGEGKLVGEKETWMKQKREGEDEDKRGVEEEEEEEEEEVEKWKMQRREGQEAVEEESEVEVEKLNEQEQDNEIEVGKSDLQKRQQHEDNKDSGVTRSHCDTVDVPAEEDDDNRPVASPETESQPVLITAEHSSCTGKETSDVKEETGKTSESANGQEKVETDAALSHHRSSEESQTPIASDTHSQHIQDCCVPQESSEMPPTDVDKSSRGASDSSVTLCSEELDMSSVKPEDKEDIDEDDLPTEQIFHNTEHHNKPPLVLLREVDKDGNEKIISDHSTSAGFIFQNCLMFELD